MQISPKVVSAPLWIERSSRVGDGMEPVPVGSSSMPRGLRATALIALSLCK